MTLYILDTDHVSLFQRQNLSVIDNIRKINNRAEQIAVTIITVQEQMEGWMNVINRNRNSNSLIRAYEGLLDAVRFFNSIPILKYDQTSYEIFQEFKRQKIRIGTQDLRIASIALSVDAIILTRNHKDFSKVPDLIIEDWTTSEVQ